MLQCISPIDGSVYVERPYADDAAIEHALATAQEAAQSWKNLTLEARAEFCGKLVDAFSAHADAIAEELAHQMGRPIQYGAGEVRGFEDRARCMISLAETALADLELPSQEGLTRFIRRVPVGVVLTVAPWNYPLLTAVNLSLIHI